MTINFDSNELLTKTETSDDGVVTTTVVHPSGKDVVAIEHYAARVAVYWHQPTDGTAPYLVVDVDTESDEPPVRVYVNDAPAYGTEN